MLTISRRFLFLQYLNRYSMPKKSSKSHTKGHENIVTPGKPSHLGNKDLNTNRPVYQNVKGRIMIRILAKPGAKLNAITGIAEESFKVDVAAPPVEGEANTELVKYIAKIIKCRKSSVSIEQGLKSRNKLLSVCTSEGLTPSSVHQRLEEDLNS